LLDKSDADISLAARDEAAERKGEIAADRGRNGFDIFTPAPGSKPDPNWFERVNSYESRLIELVSSGSPAAGWAYDAWHNNTAVIAKPIRVDGCIHSSGLFGVVYIDRASNDWFSWLLRLLGYRHGSVCKVGHRSL
jgi:hypothetical protein